MTEAVRNPGGGGPGGPGEGGAIGPSTPVRAVETPVRAVEGGPNLKCTPRAFLQFIKP